MDSRQLQSRTHVMLFSLLGSVTEMERVGFTLGQEGRYILRHHSRSQTAGEIIKVGSVMDSMSWTGFRYQDDHWSFVKGTHSVQFD